MANAKISALTASTTPLAGTEVLAIVQSSATKQVSVANLTAGRSVSMADATLSTGNLVIGTSGKGIDFSATPGTGTSEILTDYEEGTWTPTLTNWTGTLAGYACYYTKVGQLVNVWGVLVPTTTLACTAASSYITGIPYNPARDGPIVTWCTAYTGQATSIIVLNRLYTPTVAATSAAFYFSCTYTV